MKEYLGKNGLRALVDNVKAWANGAFSARAFAKVKVGSAVVQASNKEDALNLVAGENVTISAQGSSVTISTQGGSCQCGTATTERDGLMSKGDKANLDEVKGWYDTAVGGSEVGSAIDKWHDVTEFLAGISDDDTLKGILDTITREVETLKSDVMTGSVVAGKAEALNVRSAVGGASKPVYINGNGFAEVCSYDLKDISDVANSAMAKANAAYSKPSGGIPKTDLASGVQESLNKADGAQPLIDDLDIIRTRASNGNSAFTDLYNGMYAKNADLAKVAKSGSYTDLTNKPSIPAAVNESTVSGWGFTKNTGTYSKPSGGIPKTDLASGVQESLNRADSAYVLTAQGIMRNELNSAITDELDSKLEAKDLGNGTITLNGSDGSTIGSFKTNQASNTAITIPVTSVSNSGATLSWGEAITLAKVNGTPITAKLPSNPAKTYKAGEGLYESTANTFAVNAATTSAMGGMKVGYAANGKKYPVSIDSEGKAFVEVPWTADGGNAASATMIKSFTLGNRYQQYSHIGTFTIPQGGYTAVLEIYTGIGYNADITQHTSYRVLIRASNGNPNGAGEYFSAAVEAGPNGGNGNIFYVVEKDASHIEVWCYSYGYSGNASIVNVLIPNTSVTFEEGSAVQASQPANSRQLPFYQTSYKGDTIPDSTSGSKGVSVKLSGTVGEPKLLTTVNSSGVTSTSETVVLGKEVYGFALDKGLRALNVGGGYPYGWFRIAATPNAYQTKINARVMLSSYYNNSTPGAYTIDISGGYTGTPSVTIVSGFLGSSFISKIRVVRSGTFYYLDIYAGSSTVRNLVQYHVMGTLAPEDATHNPSIEGMAVFEFDLADGFKTNGKLEAQTIYENGTSLSEKYIGRHESFVFKGDRGALTTENVAQLHCGLYNSYESMGGANTLPINYASLVQFGNLYYTPQMCLSNTGKRLWFRNLTRSADKEEVTEWNEVAFKNNEISASASDKGVSVAFGGTVGAPTVSVTTTTGGVSSSNQGIVSGSEVFGFVKDSKLELKKADGGTIGTFTTNQAQGTAITFNNASTSSAGLMSASDKTKLNSAVAGSGVTSIQVVSALPSNPDSNTLYIIK